MAEEAERDPAPSDAPGGEPRTRRRPLRRIPPVRVALIAALASLLALGGMSGWLGYRAHQADQAERLRAQWVQAARQVAVNLTTIDHTRADADVQRILDSATGEFYEDFKARSAPFIDVVKKVQSTSVGTVTEAGLESSSGREGQVLVAVTVLTSTLQTPDTQPRYWRMRLTVTDQDGSAKVRRVDFVA